MLHFIPHFSQKHDEVLRLRQWHGARMWRVVRSRTGRAGQVPGAVRGRPGRVHQGRHTRYAKT